MSIGTQKLELNELILIVEEKLAETTVRWQGISEIQDPEASLGPFLRALIPQLESRKLVMDFTALDYMNSATLQPLLRMLRALNDNQISTELIYNSAMDWQRVNFRSIKTITTALSHISIVSSNAA